VFTIISRQETVKRDLRNKTLHEWMCFEAESILRHNWTDVAVHDRKILNKMRPGETRLWAIYELGSAFLPMYCRLYEKDRNEKSQHEVSAVEVFMLRFFKEDQIGAVEGNYRRSTKFFLITKGCSEYDYAAFPLNLHAVVDLVFCGNANYLLRES
jgi:hypothetical protein